MTTHAAVSGLLTVLPVPGQGAEDVLVGPEGEVYTGTEDGTVWRVRDAGARLERVGFTGGRPLGLEWLPDGRILVCDARLGLLAMDPGTGAVEELTRLVHGRRMVFCNNAAVAGDGTVFFTDSSRLYGIDRWKADMVENTATGRLLLYPGRGTGFSPAITLGAGLGLWARPASAPGFFPTPSSLNLGHTRSLSAPRSRCARRSEISARSSMRSPRSRPPRAPKSW